MILNFILRLKKKFIKFEIFPPSPKKILIYDASHSNLLKKLCEFCAYI